MSNVGFPLRHSNFGFRTSAAVTSGRTLTGGFKLASWLREQGVSGTEGSAQRQQNENSENGRGVKLTVVTTTQKLPGRGGTCCFPSASKFSLFFFFFNFSFVVGPIYEKSVI